MYRNKIMVCSRYAARSGPSSRIGSRPSARKFLMFDAFASPECTNASLFTPGITSIRAIREFSNEFQKEKTRSASFSTLRLNIAHVWIYECLLRFRAIRWYTTAAAFNLSGASYCFGANTFFTKSHIFYQDVGLQLITIRK